MSDFLQTLSAGWDAANQFMKPVTKGYDNFLQSDFNKTFQNIDRNIGKLGNHVGDRFQDFGRDPVGTFSSGVTNLANALKSPGTTIQNAKAILSGLDK